MMWLISVSPMSITSKTSAMGDTRFLGLAGCLVGMVSLTVMG